MASMSWVLADCWGSRVTGVSSHHLFRPLSTQQTPSERLLRSGPCAGH